MDLFSTTALNRVVEELELNPAFFLNAFYTTVETSETEDVKFDVVKGRPMITPFCSPIVAGKVIQEKGFETKSLSPAYLKDKREFNPNRQFKRRAGEKIGGQLAPEQRLAASVNFALNEQLEMWVRRLEVMAAEVTRTGKAVLKGENYPETLVDFGRHADLTVALAGSARWSDATVNPLKDIEAWGQRVFDISGLVPKDVIMAPNVWQVVQSKAAGPDTDAIAKYIRLNLDTTVSAIETARASLGPLLFQPGVRLVGIFGDYRLWVHSDHYIDPEDGVTKKVLPDGEITMAAPGIEGVRHFGAIRDLKAGIQPREFFVKSWEVEDPSVRWVLGQSAPLIVPYRPNGTFGAKVL